MRRLEYVGLFRYGCSLTFWDCWGYRVRIGYDGCLELGDHFIPMIFCFSYFSDLSRKNRHKCLWFRNFRIMLLSCF